MTTLGPAAATRSPSPTGGGGRVARVWRALRWYVREVTGESAYDRYVERARRCHPGEPVLDRRAFERQRQDREAQRPQQRCC